MVELDPEDVQCNNIRGMALVKLGRRDEAGATMAQALALDPEARTQLLALAGRELLSTDVRASFVTKDFGVVPLGMPLIAGPASITTLLVLAQNESIGLVVTLAALVVRQARHLALRQAYVSGIDRIRLGLTEDAPLDDEVFNLDDQLEAIDDS